MTLHVPLAIRVSGGAQDQHVTREARSLTFRSTIPGGFASCQVQLDRPLSLNPDELEIYSDLFIYDGRSGATIWQGRLEDPGRGATGQGQIWTLRAAGPAAHARDRKVKLIYVDTSLDRWFPVSGGSATPNDDGGESLHGTIGDQDDESGLRLRCPRGVVAAVAWNYGEVYRELVEAGQDLGRVAYRIDGGKIDGGWREQAITRSGIGGSGTIAADDDMHTTSSTRALVIVTNFPAGDDVLELRIQRITSSQTPADEDTWGYWTELVVMARRFDKAGALLGAAEYTADTILASKIVEDLLGRLLDQFDGAAATVTATTKLIDQLAYPDGATPERVLADMMIIEPTFYWAAWEGDPARFEWRTWPTIVRYEATAVDGFDSPGSAAELFNEITVRWRDPQGRIRRTLRTATVKELDDAGLTRTAYIDLADEFGSSSIADDVGDAFLTEHASPPNAGTLTIKRPIQDLDAGRAVDPWEIRPGNLIRVRDVRPNVDALNATDRDAVTVFRIVAATYSASDNAARLELDSRPKELAGLLAASERRIERLRKR